MNYEFKGEKGVWYIDHEESGQNEFGVLATAISTNIGGAKIIGIAEVYGNDDKAIANAQLISCAPEMFEMLNKIVVNWDFINDGKHYNPDMEEARELLKKATTI